MRRSGSGRAPRVAAALLAAGAAGALWAGSAAWSAPADEKARVDQRLERAQERLRQAQGREQVLTEEVGAYSARIRELEGRLGPLRARADRLGAELAALRVRLERLTERLDLEKRRLAEAEDALARRQVLLGRRLRELYARGEPDPILVLVESGSLSAAIETADVLQMIVDRDRDLSQSVRRYAGRVRETRDEIASVRAEVAAAEARTEVASEEAEAAKAELERQRSRQQTLLNERSKLLGRARGDRREIEAETRDLQARSAALAEKIRAAQGVSSSAPSGSVAVGPVSSSGMAWPVSGTITSAFGPRWGRMHEGLDIAGGYGTPIAAAAGGTVIVAGWNGGYGNLVVVDHGNGLSTAYAHMASVAVRVGQSVGQGTVVGAMGSTGNSTGVHVHFEVRVNGGAVNPIGYL